MQRIVWTLPAQADLHDINAWLTKNRSPVIAVRVLTAIHARAAFLQTFPHGGRPASGGERVLRAHGTPYLIIYRLSPGQAEVLRVRHEREDWLVSPEGES